MRRFISRYGSARSARARPWASRPLRQAGVAGVDADWYAFLDDDDQWVPSKIERQLEHVKVNDLDVSSAAILLRGPTGIGNKPIPKTPYVEGQAVSEYLFASRGLQVARPLMHTSTLMVSRDALHSVEWDPELTVHQDWDFVLKLDAQGCRIGQLAQPLAHVGTGTGASMSASNKWSRSHEWWAGSAALMSERAKADFLYSQVLRYALRERSTAGVRQVVASARSTGWPSLGAVSIAASGLVPRSLFEKAMLKSAGANDGSIVPGDAANETTDVKVDAHQ